MLINYEEKKSIREAIGEELVELAKENPDIVVLDADLSGSTKTSLFAKNFPERFFNVGIAEQNLITTALGLSLTGKIPFAASFAMFATGRTYDQIRNSVCYNNSNVKIIGAHGGVTVGEDGASHQAIEDIALMRNLPNMTVIAPADYNQTRQAIKYITKLKGPVYIRSTRINVPNIYDENYTFSTKADVLKTGSDVTIISYGDIMSEVVKAGEILQKAGINAEIINVPVIKPLDTETILKSIIKTRLAITVENHSVNGGLGSAICEYISAVHPAKIVRLGVNDSFGQSGTPKELLKHFGIDAESIAGKVIEIKK